MRSRPLKSLSLALGLLLFTPAVATLSYAQANPPRKVIPSKVTPNEGIGFVPRLMIGGTGGVNLSNVLFQPSLQEKMHVGYDAGVILRYDVKEYAGVWLEVDYSSRGWQEVNESAPGYLYDRTINYLHVPVMTHFMIGGGAFKLTVDAGAHFGYYLGESSRMTPSGDAEAKKPFDKHHDMKVQNPLFWGVGGGLGAEYHISRHIVAGVRGSYVYGFGDLFHNTRSDIFVKSSEQIISVKAYVLYAF